MNTWLLTGVGVIAVLVGGFYLLNSYIYNEKQATVAADYKGTAVVIVVAGTGAIVHGLCGHGEFG